jgi:acetyl esterase/lipase
MKRHALLLTVCWLLTVSCGSVHAVERDGNGAKSPRPKGIEGPSWADVVAWTHSWDLRDATTYKDDGCLWSIPAATRVDSIADRGKNNRALVRDQGPWSSILKTKHIPGPRYVASSTRFNGRPAMFTDPVGPGGFGKVYSMMSPVADPGDKALWFNPPDGYSTPYWGAVLCRPANGLSDVFGAWDACNGHIGTTATMAKGLSAKPYWGMTTSLGRGDPWPSTNVEGSEDQTVLVIGKVDGDDSFMEINWRDADGELQTSRTRFKLTNYTAKEIFFGFVHSSYVSAAGLKTGSPTEAEIDAVRDWSTAWLPPTGHRAVEPLEQQSHTYKKVGDLEIRAEVFFDPASPTPRPVIVHIHGGALMGGQRAAKLDAGARLEMKLIDAGCAIVSIDYRLAPETKLPEILQDVVDAHAWVREHGPALFGADPGRMATMGGSAGGYLTLVAGYRVSPRPRALVSFYGYGDIAGDWYSKPSPYHAPDKPISEEHAWSVVGKTPLTQPPPNMALRRLAFYTWCRQTGYWPKAVTGFDPATQDEKFDSFCPVRNVTEEYPPTLLLHGEKDTDVPCEQSVVMAAELKRVGVEHELVTYPNGFHGFDAFWQAPQFRDDAIDAQDRAYRFLIEHLK